MIDDLPESYDAWRIGAAEYDAWMGDEPEDEPVERDWDAEVDGPIARQERRRQQEKIDEEERGR